MQLELRGAYHFLILVYAVLWNFGHLEPPRFLKCDFLNIEFRRIPDIGLGSLSFCLISQVSLALAHDQRNGSGLPSILVKHEKVL